MSTPVRLDAETSLFGRWQGSLLFVYQRGNDPETGLPPATNRPVTPTGTTTLYNDPIAYGLALVGYPASNPAVVADSDVGVASAVWINFLDLAEYRMLQNLIGSYTDVTESDFGRSASYSDLMKSWQARATELGKQLAGFLNPYRVGASSGAIRNVPPTAIPPRWGPGYNGRNRGGYYGGGNCGGGWGGW